MYDKLKVQELQNRLDALRQEYGYRIWAIEAEITAEKRKCPHPNTWEVRHPDDQIGVQCKDCETFLS